LLPFFFVLVCFLAHVSIILARLSENDGTEGHDSEVTVESLGTADQSGWMTKYSGALGTKKTWRKRYFVLKGVFFLFNNIPCSK